MARDFARQFYNSRTWQTTRSAYMEHCRGLCERCLQKGLIVPAEIVHHKEELTPSNITDVDIAVGFGNLEALCRPCHAEVHEETDLDYGFLEMQTIDIAIEALLSANADGCDGCKYVNKDEYEMPCLVCKRNHVDKWTPRKD